ncbi:MAG: tryptophan--tRNA ligase, partial [Candidatus Paceibacterota bacterium]
MSKTLLSGIQPTGRPHIGNYFGAMKQFVDLAEKYDSYIFIAEYHALTTIHDREQLRTNIFDLIADYLAIGLDPEEITLYRQSAVPEVTELTWIFNTLITVPFLERAHAYKDKVAKGIEPTMGLFNYPVLMAADILLVDADVVPVGEDQRQHVEIAREIARKFNHQFGETFKEPQELIQDTVAVVPGIDGQKMSKSYNNDIPLFASDEELEKAVMSIVTDSAAVEEEKDPEKDNVFALHKLFTSEGELEKVREGYEKGGLSYGESKKILLGNMKEFITPLRARREEIISDRDYVLGVLEEGGKKA